MSRTIYHITAKHKKSFLVVDLYFPSISMAQKHNPGMEDFTIVGLAK